jgi:hypothetical protein
VTEIKTIRVENPKPPRNGGRYRGLSGRRFRGVTLPRTAREPGRDGSRNAAKVRLACHPHDPYTPPGYRGVTRVLGTVEGLKRFVEMHESPYHGLNFCQGTIAEMLDDPAREIFEVIRWFGERAKIFNVHFRNIKGRKLDFMEAFPDEGDMDMPRALAAYRDVGYPYMLMPDHVPQIDGRDRSGVAFAYCYGSTSRRSSTPSCRRRERSRRQLTALTFIADLRCLGGGPRCACHKRTFTADDVARAVSLVGYASSPSSAFASLTSGHVEAFGEPAGDRRDDRDHFAIVVDAVRPTRARILSSRRLWARAPSPPAVA